MVFHYRLDVFGLARRAIEELDDVELHRRWYECRNFDFDGIEYTIPVFDSISLDLFLKEFQYDEEKYPVFLDALIKITSDLHKYYSPEYDQYLYKYVEDYFGEYEAYRQAAEKIENYFNTEEGQTERAEIIKINQMFPIKSEVSFESLFLRKLSQEFDYFPHDYSRFGVLEHNPQNLKCAGEAEEDYVGDGEISKLMDLRDYAFSVGFYPDTTYLNGTPFTEIELAARECLKKIILEGYMIEILGANYQFQGLVENITNAIDDKWSLLISKHKRGIYRDEWGLIHQEAWERDFRYFALNVAANSDNVPKLLLYMDIDFNELKDNLIFYSLVDYDEIILSFTLKTDNAELQEIRNLKGSSLKSKKDEFIVDLCTYLFYLKMDSEDAFLNDIDVSTVTDSLNSSEIVSNSSDTGRIFELRTKELLEDLGYTISLTPITGDQGVDIIATRNGKKYAIQCKSYTGQVGNAAVQEVIAGRIFYDCDYACVVTDSSFTPSAYQLAAKAGVIMCANENLDPLK